MEYAVLILSILSLAVSVFIFLKISSEKKINNGADAEEIRKICNSSFNDLAGLVSSNIDKTNKNYIENIQNDIKKLNEQMDKFKSEMSAVTEKENQRNVENMKERFEEFSKRIDDKLAVIAKNVDDNLGTLRRENTEKLESIQKTVDEKLQKTLEGRLKDTFDSVITQMNKVNTAMGEIKGLASDVGSLKNVLTNVKTKGIVGEVILGNIIKEILTKEQYSENIATKKGSRDVVEFAVKMPAGDRNDFVYLPIDSKFPLETYYKLKDCADRADKEGIESARKELRAKIKAFAKDIKTKYIDVPYTTDFAIMFLPIEGLYIETIDSGLFEEIQKDYKINIAGPSTLTALINALQMGFKSYIIQKRSAEVFTLLKNVEEEFSSFADVLAKAQSKISSAGDELERLVGTRTRMIQSKFKKLGELPSNEEN